MVLRNRRPRFPMAKWSHFCPAWTGTCRTRHAKWCMAAFVAPYLSEYAEMDNDLSGCMDRIFTHDAPVKTGRPGDCVATQLGGFRAWDAARWTSPTPLCSSSSHCSTRDRLSSPAHRLDTMAGSRESKSSSSSGRRSAPAVARRDTVKVYGSSNVREWMESFDAVSGLCSSIATGGSAVWNRRDLLFALSTRGSPSFEAADHRGRRARGRASALGTAVTLGESAGTDCMPRGAHGLRFWGWKRSKWFLECQNWALFSCWQRPKKEEKRGKKKKKTGAAGAGTAPEAPERRRRRRRRKRKKVGTSLRPSNSVRV